jgi:hypothetical protein
VPVLTATECTVYAPALSASAATITTSGLIPVVQERINYITNNYFTTGLYVQSSLTFNATDRTIICTGLDWASYGFAAGDEVYLYNSYRNDGYVTISSVSTSTLTIVTGTSVVDELSGRSILVSVVKWPTEVKYIAAQMVYYDYDIRKTRSPGVTSRSLGPFSESFGGTLDAYGYPSELVDSLSPHRIVRLM